MSDAESTASSYACYPPFEPLPIRTEVSAKYRGAFCEATITKVVPLINVRVLIASTKAIVTVPSDRIRGDLSVHANVQLHKDTRWIPVTIKQISDASVYTVMFDDGDVKTLRRGGIQLQGKRHFKEVDTLDGNPLINPEQFVQPIKKRKVDDGDTTVDQNGPMISPSRRKPRKAVCGAGDERELVFVERTCDSDEGEDSEPSSTSLKFPYRANNAVFVPAIVVPVTESEEFMGTPGQKQCVVKYFQDSQYGVVDRVDLVPFTEDAELLLQYRAFPARLQCSNEMKLAIRYLESGIVPDGFKWTGWEAAERREAVFVSATSMGCSLPSSSKGQSSKEKSSSFIQRWKTFMENSGSSTSVVTRPMLGTRELDVERLFSAVIQRGGMEAVTCNQLWKKVCLEMDFPSVSTGILKQAYGRLLFGYECSPLGKEELATLAARSSINIGGTYIRRRNAAVDSDDELEIEDNIVQLRRRSGGFRYIPNSVVSALHDDGVKYRAKIIEMSMRAPVERPNSKPLAHYLIHYLGWNIRYDEWVPENRLSDDKNLSLSPSVDHSTKTCHVVDKVSNIGANNRQAIRSTTSGNSGSTGKKCKSNRISTNSADAPALSSQNHRRRSTGDLLLDVPPVSRRSSGRGTPSSLAENDDDNDNNDVDRELPRKPRKRKHGTPKKLPIISSDDCNNDVIDKKIFITNLTTEKKNDKSLQMEVNNDVANGRYLEISVKADSEMSVKMEADSSVGNDSSTPISKADTKNDNSVVLKEYVRDSSTTFDNKLQPVEKVISVNSNDKEVKKEGKNASTKRKNDGDTGSLEAVSCTTTTTTASMSDDNEADTTNVLTVCRNEKTRKKYPKIERTAPFVGIPTNHISYLSPKEVELRLEELRRHYRKMKEERAHLDKRSKSINNNL